MDAFPNYWMYVAALATRNMVVVKTGIAVLVVMVPLYCAHILAGDRTWLRLAAWFLGIGVFYASLVLAIVWSFTNSAPH